MRRPLTALLVAVVMAVVAAPAVAGPKAYLKMVSDPGDYIGQGQTNVYTPVDGVFTGTVGTSGTTNNVVMIRFNAGSTWWNISLAGPMGIVLEPGTYVDAQRYPFQSPTKPGLDFSGSGRGCNQLSGTFTIYDIAYGPNSTVTRLFADIEQHCEMAAPALRARIIYQGQGSPSADRDWDRRSDLTVFRPSNGTWYSALSSTSFSTASAVTWGLAGDIAAPEDFDADGASDDVVYRGGLWYALQSSRGYTTMLLNSWGLAGDVPVAADYDGDGRADFAVFRPDTGVWYIRRSISNYVTSWAFSFGATGDLPVPADYDGDGRTDIAVFRPSTGVWYILTSASSFVATTIYAFGMSGDVPVPADYDGDRRADLAVFRPAQGAWFTASSTSGYASVTAFQWGVSGDAPVPSDYDGDGRVDAAVFRPASGAWYVRNVFTLFWGLAGDVVVNK